MTRYVAFLRAVNVGGRNRVPMAELAVALSDAGLERISTVLQSGNVLFDSSESEEAVAATIAGRISAAFGLQIGVVVRTSIELVAVSRSNPFLAAGAERDPTTLHVAFLAEQPRGAAIAALLGGTRPGSDAFAVDGREVYLSYPNGSGRSPLTLPYLERHLGTQGTARNWRTVLRLAHLCAATA